MEAKDIKVGMRVLMPAIPEDDIQEERGVVLTKVVNGTTIVKVDPQYKLDEDDDLIRETPIEQIEPET